MRIKPIVAVLLLAALLAMGATGCSEPQPATPLPLRQPTPLRELFSAEAGTTAPEAPVGAAPAAEPTARLFLPETFEVEATCTPCAVDDLTDVTQLPIGLAGNYVNMAYGYRLEYPTDWFTGFGNRPVQVLFSNLDPSTHTREDMRQQGCLIEIKPWVTPNNVSLTEMRAQMPRAFEGAEEIELDGEVGLLMSKRESGDAVHRRWVYAEHAGRTYLISMDYAANQDGPCRPAWDQILASWRWFEPRILPYRNTVHGYALSMPTHWYRFGQSEEGLWFGDTDPSTVGDVRQAVENGILCRALVHENPDGLTLREWLAQSDLHIHQTDTMELDGIEAVRVLGESTIPDTEFMSGLYVGRLGEIVEVVCFYPADQNWRFTPIANGILYSVTF